MKLVRLLGVLLILGLSSLNVAGQVDISDPGEEYSQKGQFELAVEFWEKRLTELSAENSSKEYVDVSVRLAEAYQSLGRLQRALEVLGTANSLATKIDDSVRRANVLSQLSDVYLAMGDLDHDGTKFTMPITHSGLKKNIQQAESFLNEAANQKVDYPLLRANILNKQGNLWMVKKEYDKALSAYEESIKLADKAGDNVLSVKTALNLIQAVATKTESHEKVKQEIEYQNILTRVNNLPDSHDKAFALITLAYLGQIPFELLSICAEQIKFAYPVLKQAIEIAERLKDNLAIAYAKGYLAELYAAERRYEEAVTLTEQAIFYARNPGILQSAQYTPSRLELQSEFENHPELLYRLEAQRGDFLFSAAQQGQEKNVAQSLQYALDSYNRAIKYLKQIYKTYRVGFQPLLKSAEDLSHKRAYLLFWQAANKTGKNQQNLLKTAWKSANLFKSLELQSYFKDECVTERFSASPLKTEKNGSEEKKPSVLKKQSVLLILGPPDRTQPFKLALSFNGTIQVFDSNMSAKELVKEGEQFRDELERLVSSEIYLVQAKRLYKALIEPVSALLQREHIETLVIIPDRELLSLPFAALYDENANDDKHFLIEHYALAVTHNSLASLETKGNKSSTQSNLTALLGGLTKGTNMLPFAKEELDSISEQLKGKNAPEPTRLDDEKFTTTELGKKLETHSNSIVHLSTHGQFSKDPEQTVLKFYEDDNLSMTQLGTLFMKEATLDERVDLLTLSACESARGAEFGLAGVAVKMGTYSALATLWKVIDKSTRYLMEEFYKKLVESPDLKAKALQDAQQLFIKDNRFKENSHPYYWAGFLLILNGPTIPNWED